LRRPEMPENEYRVCRETKRGIQSLIPKNAEQAKSYSNLRAEKEVVERDVREVEMRWELNRYAIVHAAGHGHKAASLVSITQAISLPTPLDPPVRPCPRPFQLPPAPNSDHPPSQSKRSQRRSSASQRRSQADTRCRSSPSTSDEATCAAAGSSRTTCRP